MNEATESVIEPVRDPRPSADHPDLGSGGEDRSAAPGENGVEVRRAVPASPADVFSAWTEPERLARWSAPEGVAIDDVTVDLRVGGEYRIHMRGPEGEPYTAFGTYREIAAPHRLQYTWDWEESEHAVGETLVTVTFDAEGEGTLVTIRHEGFATGDRAAGHGEGWESCLNRLVAYASE